MTVEHIYIEGELYLTLETVAEVYSVKTVWLERVCREGLLGPPVSHGESLCLAAIELDRVARIVRLNAVLGLELEAIAAMLEED